MDDWYDGPLAGFAAYRGAPHHYYRISAASDDEERFELVPVSAELLAAGQEASAIFKRWSAARGESAPKSAAPIRKAEFGALPEDRARYSLLRAKIVPYEAPGHPDGFTVWGKFERDEYSRVQWRDDPAPRPYNER